MLDLVDSAGRGHLGHPPTLLSGPLSASISGYQKQCEQASDVNGLKAPANHEPHRGWIFCAASDRYKGAQQVRPRGDEENGRSAEEPSEKPATAASPARTALPRCSS
ncbi:hypothetical protein [Mycobacterium szulgai]|uniref:hypothetical protein n=1 Tax=Mycobacterium szulgai TaxID=1787 RepID=UPI00146FA023|nr:hypothetical protein [Mycobacterium szulgai]MCV7078459.1 hypothetical protein [Mycobacterium szulgai]